MSDLLSDMLQLVVGLKKKCAANGSSAAKPIRETNDKLKLIRD